MIPKPLARISYHYGPPMVVPPGIKGDEVEKYRRKLEQKLNALYREAQRTCT